MKLDCVLFDHDDTLLPTFALRAKVLSQAAQEVLDIDIDSQAFLAAAHGRNLEQMSVELTRGDSALAARLVRVYRALYYEANSQGLEPYPGIAVLLTHLRKRGIRVGVVTSKLASGARDELSRTGLDVHIEHLTGAEDVQQHKPAAEPLLRAIKALEVDASRTLMVGDTTADILGARAAGTRSGAALWGAHDPDSLRELNPDHLLETPAQILNLL
ncbi:MAG: HAD superfamily hydrolase (TIGR01509 family) [Gammaproteobacteria bacterium]|jgi:HAD superfamily hydrolase (TIGR01509 family)